MRWRVTTFYLVITCLTCDDDDDGGREHEEGMKVSMTAREYRGRDLDLDLGMSGSGGAR